MVKPYEPAPFQALDRAPLAKGPVPTQMVPHAQPGVAAVMKATDEKHSGEPQMEPWEKAVSDQAAAAYSDVVSLDPRDPFEAALIPIVQTNRLKRADYALDDDPFSNFRGAAAFLGHPAWMSALFNCVQKLERIKSLAANGRLEDTKNEAVEDTILDNAVYGVIAWAIYNSENTLRGEQSWNGNGLSSSS